MGWKQKWSRVQVIACLALALLGPGQGWGQGLEVGNYAKFPGPAPEVWLEVFRLASIAPVDAEDNYPMMAAVRRKGLPVWSRIFSLGADWPLLNTQVKVAWTADASGCLFGCRVARDEAALVGLALGADSVRQMIYPVEDVIDEALQAKGDLSPTRTQQHWVETVEIAPDGTWRATVRVIAAAPHTLTVTLDRTAPKITKWAMD